MSNCKPLCIIEKYEIVGINGVGLQIEYDKRAPVFRLWAELYYGHGHVLEYGDQIYQWKTENGGRVDAAQSAARDSAQGRDAGAAR
eukprot:6194009-Pleurochrysis_carterae.AAC.3